MARPHPALIELAAGRRVPQPQDLDQLLESAIEHRMHGLLWSLVEKGKVSGDDRSQTSLAIRSLRIEAHHRRLWKTLESVIDRLASIGIVIATFKGVTAEARWYDRISERPTRDVDLLVAPESKHRMGDAVRLLQPDHLLDGRVQRLVDKGHLQSIDIEHRSGAWIDLHADLLKYDLPTRQAGLIWERMVPHPLPSGGTVLVPDAEMSLIQLLLHLNKDRFSHLLQFADVARILSQETLDWDFISRFAHDEGLAVPLFSSLGVVLETLELGIQVPLPAPGWRRVTWGLLWRPSSRLHGDLGIATRVRRQFWIPFMIPGRTREAVVRWWRRLLPPSDLLSYYYPGLEGSHLKRLVLGRLRNRRWMYKRLKWLK